MDGGALPRSAPPAPRIPGSCAARRRPASPELLRCSRRRRPATAETGGSAAAVARRNERERNRVKLVNLGFQALRQHVPHGGASKKLSKVETLRSAPQPRKPSERPARSSPGSPPGGPVRAPPPASRGPRPRATTVDAASTVRPSLTNARWKQAWSWPCDGHTSVVTTP
ncbi:hypothetical protein H8957_009815 [Semnopithecus entellus]